MHRIRAFMIALTAAAMLATLGCPPAKDKTDDGKKPGEPAQPDQPVAEKATTIAEVNGAALSTADFERQFDRTRARFKQGNREIPPALEVRLKENILRRLVEDELIAQKAKAEGVALTDEEFEARFGEHRKRFGTTQAYEDFLKRTGQTEEQLRAELRKSLLRERLYAKLVPDVEPSDQDAADYYKTNIKRYIEPEQVKASHILLSYKETDAAEVKKEKLGKCKKLLGQAKKKGADFAELAKANSEGPTAPRGGDLGFFPRGRMVPAFEQVAFKARPGQLLGPVESQFGCHVIKVYEKKKERQRPIDEVKASVVATLKAIKKSEHTRTLLNELRRGAKVTVLDPSLKYQVPPEPKRTAMPTTAPSGPAKPAMPTPLPKPAPKAGTEAKAAP